MTLLKDRCKRCRKGNLAVEQQVRGEADLVCLNCGARTSLPLYLPNSLGDKLVAAVSSAS